MDLIGQLKGKLPNGDLGETQNPYDTIFRYANSNLIKLLKDFIDRESDFLKIFNKETIKNLFDNRKEVKSTLTDFQFLFLKNLLYRLIDKSQDLRGLLFDFFEFSTEPDIKIIVSKELLYIKQEIDAISIEIGNSMGWQKLDGGIFESKDLLAGHIKIVIPEMKMEEKTRLIMIKYLFLEQMKEVHKKKKEDFEKLLEKHFGNSSRDFEIEPFPLEFIGKLPSLLRRTAETINNLISSAISEPIPIMLRKLMHNCIIQGLKALKYPDIDAIIEDIDKAINISENMRLISKSNANSLKKVKLLGDSLAHSGYIEVYTQNIDRDIRTIQIVIGEFQERLSELLRDPPLAQDKMNSIAKPKKPAIEKEKLINKLKDYLSDKKIIMMNDSDFLSLIKPLDLDHLGFEVYETINGRKVVFAKVFNENDTNNDVISSLDKISRNISNLCRAFLEKIPKLKNRHQYLQRDDPEKAKELHKQYSELQKASEKLHIASIIIYTVNAKDNKSIEAEFQKLKIQFNLNLELTFANG